MEIWATFLKNLGNLFCPLAKVEDRVLKVKKGRKSRGLVPFIFDKLGGLNIKFGNKNTVLINWLIKLKILIRSRFVKMKGYSKLFSVL